MMEQIDIFENVKIIEITESLYNNEEEDKSDVFNFEFELLKNGIKYRGIVSSIFDNESDFKIEHKSNVDLLNILVNRYHFSDIKKESPYLANLLKENYEQNCECIVVDCDDQDYINMCNSNEYNKFVNAIESRNSFNNYIEFTNKEDIGKLNGQDLLFIYGNTCQQILFEVELEE